MMKTATGKKIDAERIAVVPLDDTARWDEFVERADGATFCHLSAWRDVVREVYGYEPLYTVAVNERGGWRGVLPLVRVRSRLTGHHLLSVPLLNYGGPLGTRDARAALARGAVAEAKRSGADRLQLRGLEPAGAGLERSEDKVTVRLELPDSAEALWKDVFRSKLRSQIRRPIKEGMEPRFGADQLGAFYDVFSRNMRDLGTPVHARRLFTSIRDRLGDRAVFGAVYWNGEPVAGGCGFAWRGEFEMTWASSLREYNRKSPNMLLYWAFMERMIQERGVRVFNFGRCTPGGGTHRFKRQWGGEDVPLAWTEWARTGDGGGKAAESAGVRVASAVWRRLPVDIANRVGPVVARRLPWW